MALSRLRASLATATSEITLTAANFNIDFTVFRYPAPATYQPFELGLSSKRRDEAEHGTIHTTARRLGQLFNELLSPTPRLIEAYGTRASEILAESQLQSRGSNVDGIFAGQAGADGTTIWAAATSGPGAVPIHLLACMLARTWDAPRAVSIWVEIVEERRKEVAESFDQNNASQPATFAAAAQEITRAHLAEWDASARAWLRVADEAKKAECQRLRVVITGLNLPVGETEVPYTSVIRTWKAAMSTMENLLKGLPQTVYSGAALVGLSAWHIFPDMVCFSDNGDEQIFGDSLVREGGVLTLGLDYIPGESFEDVPGVHWSLSLAHMKYYGPPIKASSNLVNDNSRVYFEQFACAALGALANVLECTPAAAAGWFTACMDQLADSSAFGSSLAPPSEQMKQQVHDFLNRQGQWVKLLGQASRMLLEGEGIEAKTANMLVGCGLRHGGEFFCPPIREYGPLLGICNPGVILQLLPNSNLRVQLLRMMVTRTTDFNSDYLIRYRATQGPLNSRPVDERHAIQWEFATVSPMPLLHSSAPPRHRRWVQLEVLRNASPCDCDSDCIDCECHGSCLPSCHKGNILRYKCKSDSDPLTGLLCDWEQYVEALDEDCSIVLDPDIPLQPYGRGYHGKGSPYERKDEFFFSPTSYAKPMRYQLVIGDPDRAALYIPSHLHTNQPLTTDHRKIDYAKRPQSAEFARALVVQDVVDLVRANQISAYQLISVLRNLDDVAMNLQDHVSHEKHTQLFRSLRALGLATNIYKMLPSATVAIKTIAMPLYKSRWIPSNFRPGSTNLDALSRSQTFSCVAMFESGHLNIEPSLLQEVFALSSEDSIYVTSAMLCDPCDQPHQLELRRVVGNVGRAGMAMLIPPQVPDMEKTKLEAWNFINHADFDGELVNAFEETSMHLSFSGYKLPLQTASQGLQDVDAYLLESFIRVRNRGKFVADLDILKSLDPHSGRVDRHPSTLPCKHDTAYVLGMQLTAIDTWEELLESPGRLAVARAHGSWLARLAITCVGAQKGYDVYVLPPSFCWQCVVTLARGNDQADGMEQLAKSVVEQTAAPGAQDLDSEYVSSRQHEPRKKLKVESDGQPSIQGKKMNEILEPPQTWGCHPSVEGTPAEPFDEPILLPLPLPRMSSEQPSPQPRQRIIVL